MNILVASILLLAQTDDSIADRPLASRAALEALAGRLAADRSERAQALLVQVRARLTDGDFHQGDRVLLEVQGEPALTDTFTVGAGSELVLPPPTVGAMPLRGVLRVEVDSVLTAYVRRFVENALVRAEPLIRLSIQGEVARAGVYGVPADAKLGDALMAAGGTTQRANMRKLRIERTGERIRDGASLELTIDAAHLKDGDQIVVAGHGGLNENLRFLWLVVSIAGGVYGLSRAFH